MSTGQIVNAQLVYELRHEEMNAFQLAQVTAVDVRDAVTLIRSQAEKPQHDAEEKAHQQEWMLRRNVLHAIAAGRPDGQALARAACDTERIGFVRWFG